MSQQSLTPRKRVEIALRGGYSGSVPFTMYATKLPPGPAEQELRQRGLCVVHRQPPVYRIIYPNVQIRKEKVCLSGKTMIRTYYETPVGTVSTLKEPAGFTSWYHELMLNSPDDYKVLRFIIKDAVYQENYSEFLQAQEAYGEGCIF